MKIEDIEVVVLNEPGSDKFGFVAKYPGICATGKTEDILFFKLRNGLHELLSRQKFKIIAEDDINEPLPEFTHPACRHVCQETEGLKGTPAEGAYMCDDGCVRYQSPSSKLAGIIDKYLPADGVIGGEREKKRMEMHSAIMRMINGKDS